MGLNFGLGLISFCSEDKESRGAGRLDFVRDFFRSKNWLFGMSVLEIVLLLTNDLTFQSVSP